MARDYRPLDHDSQVPVARGQQGVAPEGRITRPLRGLALASAGERQYVGQTMRLVGTRFGSFEELMGTGVHRDPWWFRRVRVASVVEPIAWVDLIACAKAGPRESNPNGALDTRWAEASQVALDPTWFRSHMGIALALHFDKTTRLSVDLIAFRMEGHVEVVYPFLLREEAQSVYCGFGGAGPDAEIRESIVHSLAARFLWAGRPYHSPV